MEGDHHNGQSTCTEMKRESRRCRFIISSFYIVVEWVLGVHWIYIYISTLKAQWVRCVYFHLPPFLTIITTTSSLPCITLSLAYDESRLVDEMFAMRLAKTTQRTGYTRIFIYVHYTHIYTYIARYILYIHTHNGSHAHLFFVYRENISRFMTAVTPTHVRFHASSEPSSIFLFCIFYFLLFLRLFIYFILYFIFGLFCSFLFFMPLPVFLYIYILSPLVCVCLRLFLLFSLSSSIYSRHSNICGRVSCVQVIHWNGPPHVAWEERDSVPWSLSVWPFDVLAVHSRYRSQWPWALPCPSPTVFFFFFSRWGWSFYIFYLFASSSFFLLLNNVVLLHFLLRLSSVFIYRYTVCIYFC